MNYLFMPGKANRMKRTRIIVTTRRGLQTVPALIVGPLAIHPSVPKANCGWSITHIPSGAKVLSMIQTQSLARDVLSRLLAWEGIDWSETGPVPDALRSNIVTYLQTVPRRYQKEVSIHDESRSTSCEPDSTCSSAPPHPNEKDSPMTTKPTVTVTRQWKRIERSSPAGVFIKWNQVGDADEGKFLGKAPTGVKNNIAFSFERPDGSIWKCWESYDLREQFEHISPGTYCRIEYAGLGSDGKVKLFHVDVDGGDDGL
jgi:hypothetical protein